MDRKLESEGGGVFWKNNSRYASLYDRDIWQQSLILEFFSVCGDSGDDVDDIRTWIIQQKRSRDWGDRLSTVLAVKSLVFYGSDWEPAPAGISIQTEDDSFSPLRVELGTDASGYYRYNWQGADQVSGLNKISISKVDSKPVWGSLLTSRSISLDTLNESGDDLRIIRTVLVESLEEDVKRWTRIENSSINTGQKVKVRLEIEASQPIDYVQLRDYRASSFEPDKSLSGYRWRPGLSWYQVQADEYTDFYIPQLPKGTSFLEYELYAEQAGDFNQGYSEIQSQYAPEYMARSGGGRIKVH